MFSLMYMASILALNTGWESKDVYFTWTPQGEEYKYVVEVYTDRELTQLYTQTDPLDTYFVYITFTESNLYFVRIKYFIPNSNEYEYFNWGQIYLNLEHEYLGEDEIWFEPEEEVLPVEQVSPPVIKDIYQYILPKDLDMREEVGSVLGSTTLDTKEICNIYMFKNGKHTDTTFRCKLGIKISKVKYLDWGEYLTLEVEGTYFDTVPAKVKIFDCRRFDILNPLTWFECKKVLVDSYEGNLPLRYIGYIKLNGITQKSVVWGFADTSFFVRNIYTKDISKENLKLSLEISSYVKGKEWIDVISTTQKQISIPKLEKSPSNKPFSFPFEKSVGVNQWYGCTTYQCPHKGIDFGVYMKEVLSIGDGKVVSIGYDKYGGECFQGGKYVIVRHTNGMHSTYFHLDSYSVKVGDIVKNGSLIGVTGNTGKWNCQNLGYHLHFETRKERISSSHVNPVQYINADWNQVPTLNYKTYPGRLTGENPHPNF